MQLGIAAVLLVIGFLGSAAGYLFHDAQVSLQHHDLVLKSALLTGSAGQRLRGDADNTADEETVAERAGAVGESLFGNPLFGVDLASSVSETPLDGQVNDLLQRAKQLAFGWREAGDALERKVDDLATTPSILPAMGYIGSSFSRNRFHPILGIVRPHLGVDIVATRGTPVMAAARGEVTFVGRKGELGLMVQIDHGSGRVTRYAHLSRTVARAGQHVERGELIGNVGSTGLAVGSHLHYEVWLNGRPVNPRKFIQSGVIHP